MKAVNAGDCAAQVPVTVTMTVAQAPSPFSRRLALPTKAWSAPCDDVLKPKETRMFDLPTGVAVQAGTMVSFVVTAGDKSITAGGFNLASPVENVLLLAGQS